MHLKEYRICMPLSVEEYRIGQLYMIAKHSHEQSEQGEGVEVIRNEPCTDPEHGQGQFTEKRVYLSSKLPPWIRSMIPRIFYITEKAWNYYPYTVTDYTCSFIPRFSVHIETKYEDNNGCNPNIHNLSQEELAIREVDIMDIAYDDFPEKKYKEEEDPVKFMSKKKNRGHLQKDWKDTVKPMMCSYKVVKVCFDVWGLQKKVEQFAHRTVRDVLLLGHRQAFAWIDEWIDLTDETKIFYLSSCLSLGQTVHFAVQLVLSYNNNLNGNIFMAHLTEQFLEEKNIDIFHLHIILFHKMRIGGGDNFLDMTLDDIRVYENQMHEATNKKVIEGDNQ